ncbi:aminoacyl-tRNA hydrolase [Propionibacterium ruminifibrarum]|uniref:Peptidyl-tRNA hydrolase n=1 Tax=Propionibacterium ruminifibrarum TaxID=1962131 RepID=A0A375I104_9ACTN|nr:aminoacyl-tRNA hydrolase [Propionibacterium ruminifibrarum]SPF68526.1 aminoacyl-tRNA hydrolase [Propionibacterium ruminifibrarum]
MTWLVAGLGNPGLRYAWTRHNVGFMVADELARRAHGRFGAPRGMHADVLTTRIGPAGVGAPGGQPVLIVKPRTFMNESGRAVGALATYHRVDTDHVIVVHDELDLDPSRMRLKAGGGDNGHNGLKSIRAHLGTGDFIRVRVGIGRPPGHQSGADYVLGRFPKNERDDLAVTVTEAADAVETVITAGLAVAQNRFNS